MTVCKICCEFLDAKKGDRRSLHGTATGANDVQTKRRRVWEPNYLPTSEEFDCFGVVSHARLASERGEVVVRAR